MIRFVLLCTSLLFLSASSYAVTDSVSLGINKDKVVYYSLKNGVVSTIQNDDWDLAFSCRPTSIPSNTLQSATVRFNEAYGVKLFRILGKKVSDFQTIDTSDKKNWVQIHDSDTSWWDGAVNIGNAPFYPTYNYGWGSYNIGAHKVSGDSIFCVQLKNGTLKKFAIVEMIRDTAFSIRIANFDNTQDITKVISKIPYKTKNFVYYDVAQNSIIDREPSTNSWDIQYCVYSDATGIRKIGSLINDICTAENNWVYPCFQSQKYSTKINSMGEFGMGNDTLAEIITDQNIHIQTPTGNYNMSFGPNNPSTNTFVFTTVTCANATGIEANSTLNATLFPNPTSGVIQLEVEAFSGKSIAISDIAGKTLFQQSLNSNTTTIDCNTFAEGIYLLRIAGEGKNEVKRFVVSR